MQINFRNELGMNLVDTHFFAASSGDIMLFYPLPAAEKSGCPQSLPLAK